MANYKTYLIGRSGDSDIQLTDESVSRSHAELVVAGGDAFLTDRVSSGGTFVYRDGTWQDLRQSWVGHEERLRFGEYEVDVRSLLASMPTGGSSVPEIEDERPRGRVARNPVTGEIESAE